MEYEKHTLMDGRLHVYRRENSRYWQCSTYLGRRNHRETTKEENLAAAKEFARDWFMERYAEDRRRRRGLPAFVPLDANAATESVADRRRKPKPNGPTFKQKAEIFLSEIAVLTQGERSDDYVADKEMHMRVHLIPYFGDYTFPEITAGLIHDFRVHSAKNGRNRWTGEHAIPSRSSMHQRMVTLRQFLKWAVRKNLLTALPDMSAPYKKSGKISHRAWFSPAEYKRLYEASRDRARNPKKERWRASGELLHDYILFMVNTGLRPDEALRLEFRDVAIVADDATGERILEIDVRGKRGNAPCKSMPGAVQPFQRLQKRSGGEPTTRLFPKFPAELFNTLLRELDLKEDREGQRRTAYSLRHTYICLRLMEGADIYQVAKNCRTSVEMIENFYASHIKNTLDAAAINVRKAKRKSVPAAEKAARKPRNTQVKSKRALAAKR